MRWNNDHRRTPSNHDSMWTSYADLFLGLSVVFLLLYVSASLRQGTEGIRQYLNNKQLSKENEDLKQQLKVYNSLKQNYLESEASKDEQQTYEMLMAKLDLLKDEANSEKVKLREAATDNEKKEAALNQYQQVVRNIINANMLSKARIKNRDVLITKKEDTIEGQSQEIGGLHGQLAEKRKELEKSEQQLAKLDKALQKKLKQLKSAYKANQLTEKIYQQRGEALREENAKRMAELESRKRQAESELASLGEQLSQKAEQNKQLNQQIGSLKNETVRAAKEVHQLKGDLAKAQENLNARKALAKTIQGRFQAGGVKADVDARTGDVLLSFEGEYFDTGIADLKPGMRTVLEKAMPSYAQSLFEDPKISSKIENVEIVGFASPTYRGKYVDPSQLKAKDREAVNYNLDLSYKRARSIFDHMLTRMQFQYKQPLLRLVKVTGRSFLTEKDKREPANEAESTFCNKVDCAKQQTVIIRFKLKD